MQAVKGNGTMASLLTNPYALHDGHGKKLQVSGTAVCVMATSEQTAGAFNLFEVACLPGYATPLHIHYGEDVAVYVLEGALTIYWGADKQAAAAGSYFYQPRGTPHGFQVAGRTPARLLCLAIPAGLDRFVVEQDQLAASPDPVTAAARYKIEILGPLPE